MGKDPLQEISAEEILHYQDLARQYSKKSLLPLFGGDYPDGNLRLLAERLTTTFETGIAASPELSMPGSTYGIWGSATDEQGMTPSLRACDASELIFEDVFVPNKNIVGKLRSGWANNRNVLNYSRPVVGAMALGHGRGAFERCLEFCRKTYLGPKRLIEYQDVQLELADMAISLWAARSMIWQSCKQFRCFQSASASAKVFASDTAFKVCNQAMELMGDHGYIHANGVERSWRDSRLTQIYEGPNQINRLALFEHHLSTDFSLPSA